ncbi:MAG TPA: hypothetical protein VKH43_11255 [Thermoanaerobaculia bacterium]|nr:hypothetical protein [Thermoanaerobaculia bacterium]
MNRSGTVLGSLTGASDSRRRFVATESPNRAVFVVRRGFGF